MRLASDLVPAVAGLLAAQGEDAGGAGSVPTHARLFENQPIARDCCDDRYPACMGGRLWRAQRRDEK